MPTPNATYPGVPPSSCWSTVICSIIKSVVSPATFRNPTTATRAVTRSTPRRVWSRSPPKAPTNVSTHRLLLTGAPRIRAAMGASVSCQVHHRKFAPMASCGA
ncbi:MAG: DUF2457 domain-containing protein [Proteobacteria bacterium]|nr:DUF2457 domain-containing protein [Pseudomonadota bacterium]MCP4921196.1 DUF2457 domain-containing protein [Pseudomonadota bacterium]